MVVVPDVDAPVIPTGTFAVQLIDAPVVEDIRSTCAVCEPEHIDCGGIENITLGLGFTVIEKFCVGPRQVSATGVTVMVATTGDDVALAVVKGVIFPVPFAANPMDGVLFIQL